MKMTPQQVSKLLADMEAAKTKLARSEGQLQAATEALAEQGFRSVKEAEDWLVNAKAEAEALQNRLGSLRNEFDAKYGKLVRKLS